MTTATKGNITLKGSTKIITEFFDYAINSILYQRGIYPDDDFEPKKKYGLTLQMVKDPELRVFLNQVLGQFSNWLSLGDVQKLVVVISDAKTRETKERWVFDIETDKEVANGGSEKPQSEIVNEIRTIIRQITSSVSYLPLLEDSCTFDLLFYTNKDLVIPEKWEETEPKYIPNSDQVKLASLSTKIHKVDSLVAYQVDY